MSRRNSVRLWSVLCLLYFALLNGCAMEDHMRDMDRNTERMAKQLEAYQEYVKVLTESLARMSATLAALERMGSPLFAALLETMFTQKPPAPTPDIDDVLNGGAGGGAPAPSGPSGSSGSGN